MKLNKKIFVRKKGFSLAELLAVLVISSMIIIAVLSLYGRLNKVSASVINKLDSGLQGREILQLISEDLERILSDARDTRINFQNRIESDGSWSARLEIYKYIYDKNSAQQIFEQIIWQTAIDLTASPTGQVLYRRHNGMALEDKLLDESKQDYEKDLFIPVCKGVTFFSVRTATFQAGSVETTNDGTEIYIDKWNVTVLPQNLIITISFAQPVEISPGQWQVPEEEKTVKVIALDRTRKIPLRLAIMDYNDVNDLNPNETVKEPNIPDTNSTNKNVNNK
jgi:prepilin-type N-terminal cleavage/methylation domain-containing protein